MRNVISILLLLLLCSPVYKILKDSLAEQKSKTIEIYPDQNSYVIDSMYMNNEESMQMLIDTINTYSTDSIREITEVLLSSHSSPDGGLRINTALPQKRTETIYQYVCKSQIDSLTEQKSKTIEIYFDLNSYVIDSTYMNNGESMQMLIDSINTYSTDSNYEITKVVLSTYLSPDGGLRFNTALTQKRNEATYQYLTDKCSMPDSLIEVNNYGIAWDLMREYVEYSDIPYNAEVVDIINNVPVETWARVNATDASNRMVDSRNKHLMELKIGNPYRQMQKSIFPYLRKSSIEIRYIHNEPEAEIVCDSISNVEPELIPEVDAEIIIEPSNEVVGEIAIAKPQNESFSRNPIFAVKTNVAGLGVGVANLGVEVPFGGNYSIDASAYYSPYTIDNEWRLRLAILQPEFRYWLSGSMQKHFFGFHAHVGLFNVSTNQWSRYQNSTDEPLWGFGLSYGYAIALSKSLNLEFNIGAGYASLSYDMIYNVENGAIYNHTERGYWGLTRVGISLSYIFNHSAR